MQRQNRNKSRKNGGPFSIRKELSDGPSYRGQQVARLHLPGTLHQLTNAGTLATAIQLAAQTDVTGFSSRFGSTFDEYRVVGADVIIRPVSDPASGVSKMWFDEKSTSAPTLNESQERIALALPNSAGNPKSSAVMHWRARDLLDLEYTPIGTSVTPVTFKVYTDAVNWGASLAPLWIIETNYLVEFRGLKST